jgi:transposase
MTIISDEKNVRNTVTGKTNEEVKKKILEIPNISNVKKVCIDMCASFAKAIREAIPHAETVADRFHIMKLINKKLMKLNQKTYKKLDEKQRSRFSQIRHILVKNRKLLKKEERRLIREYLQLNPDMKSIYWKIQDFRKILFNSCGQKHGDVSEKLAAWIIGCRKYLKKFIGTLERWWDEVVNACIYKENNGRQEGINNKIKMVKRRGYGYRNCLNFEQRIYAECNV